MAIPDYIPDVEPSKPAAPPPSGKTTSSEQPSIKDLAKLWESGLPDPMTFEQAGEQFDKVARFGWKVVDSICHGTCPPAEFLVPDLHKAIKDVETLRDGFQALVNNNAGDASWAADDKRYQRAKAIGLNVFLQSAAAMSQAGAEHDKILDYDPRRQLQKKKDEWGYWKGAIVVVLGIATVATFADFVKAVKGRD